MAPPTAADVAAALDLPELVHSLRQQRMGMVQTMDQYQFVYLALKEELGELAAEEERARAEAPPAPANARTSSASSHASLWPGAASEGSTLHQVRGV